MWDLVWRVVTQTPSMLKHFRKIRHVYNNGCSENMIISPEVVPN